MRDDYTQGVPTDSPYAQSSPSMVFVIPPPRWFKVRVIAANDRVIEESVEAHSVSTTETGGLVFQMLRPSIPIRAFDTAKGESVNHAKLISPPNLDMQTVRIFAAGSYTELVESVVPTFTVGQTTRAN